MPREVTLVLQTRGGEVLGALEPFTVSLPWWSEAAELVEAARVERGADVSVLRLLEVEKISVDMGGRVTYVAELHGAAPHGLRAVPAEIAAAALGDDPLRLPWARPGGPARELAWADDTLRAHGRERTGPARQMRTWNLSSIWSLPTAGGPVWLKSVPPFFAHEGPVIEWLADPALPPVVASTPGRVLLADIPGVDHYDAALPILQHAVETLVAIQHRVASRIDELFALGLPDWRWPRLRVLVDDVVERHAHELTPTERDAIARLVDGFDARTAAVDACGLPMTLVHGDFHPGNLRGGDVRPFILDWGDCAVGHPLLDVPAMVERVEGTRRDTLMSAWTRAWLDCCPGADPARAAALLAPIAALRQAVVYRGFLDAIEPSERCYHANDPAFWLRRAAGIGAVT